MIPYEYVEYTLTRGERVVTDRTITDWTREARQRRGLKSRMVMLMQVDRDMAVGSLVFKTDVEGIYYAKIRGNVALRPRLCLGPYDADREVTFLERATEVNFRVTKGACARAAERMKEVTQDALRREQIDPEALWEERE